MKSSSSGRFLLRLPRSLHAALQVSAREVGISLNEYCVRRLSLSGSGLSVQSGAAAVVEAATRIVGKSLLAIVVYGSWARGEATMSSDVDVLVVVQTDTPLTRQMYRAWDETPLTWDERPVDPHFVHPPPADIEGGAWAEAAIDGTVVFERGRIVSTELARIRGLIAEGRLVRRRVQGQPYWTVAA